MAAPHQVLGGRDEQGKFRTAAAKEYPSSLCKAVALAIVDNVSDMISNGPCSTDDVFDSPPPLTEEAFQANFSKYVVPFDAYNPETYMEIGADCMLFNR